MSLALADLKDSRTPCRRAEDACLKRLREILIQLNPADGSLRRLLEDVERHDRELMEDLHWIDGAASEEDLDVKAYFPSLRQSLGEAPLDRDNAMYYVESMKEEAWRFFRDLARLATDDAARAAFARVALDEIGQVARLRTVIL